MTPLLLNLLGPQSLFKPDGEPADRVLAQTKRFVLLSYFAIKSPRGLVQRDELLALFWPELDEAHARNSLSRALSFLRKELGSGVIITRGLDTVGVSSESVSCDASEFERAASEARDEDALRQYRGAFLQGIHVSTAYELNDWMERERAHFAALHCEVVKKTTHSLIRAGEFDRALWLVTDRLRLHPDCASGRSLERDVRAAESGAAAPAGIVRRGDLSIERTSEPALRLPQIGEPAMPLLGREEEMGRLRGMLRDPLTRLVSIIGPGGVGKSRLAVQLAREEAHTFADGVCTVALNSIGSADQLPGYVARQLGCTLDEREDATQRLCAYLQDRELLLVLDNFEHLTAGVAVVDELLSHSPGLRVITTSRQELGLRREHVLPLGGLLTASLTGTGPQEEGGAEQLYLLVASRAGVPCDSLRAKLPTISMICRIIDGLPLAIELAASWSRVMAPEQILDMLNSDPSLPAYHLVDLPEHHKSFQSVFDASWSLLSTDEQRTLARLSVFKSAFGFEEAIRIGDALPATIGSLIGKSLLSRPDMERYTIHDLIRRCANAKLSNAPADLPDARRRHAVFFTRQLDAAVGIGVGVGTSSSVAVRLQARLDDVRDAWRYLLEQYSAEGLEQMLEPLFQFSRTCGQCAFGYELLSEALDHDLTAVHARFSSRVRVRAAVLAHLLGFGGPASETLRKCADEARKWDDDREVVLSTMFLASVMIQQEQFAEAEELLRDNASLLRETDRLYSQNIAFLGECLFLTGRTTEAETCFHAALESSDAIGATRGRRIALINLGVCSAVTGRTKSAREHFCKALALTIRGADDRTRCTVLNNLGSLCMRTEDYRHAGEYLAQAVGLAQGQRLMQFLPTPVANLGYLAIRLGNVKEARDRLTEAFFAAHRYGCGPALRFAALGLGFVLHRQGQLDRAATFAGFGAGRDDCSARDFAELKQLLLGEMPQRRFDELLEVGATSTVEALIAELAAADLAAPASEGVGINSIRYSQAAIDC